MNKIDNIVEKMQRIVKYARINIIDVNKIMITRINKYCKFIKYEIEKYV